VKIEWFCRSRECWAALSYACVSLPRDCKVTSRRRCRSLRGSTPGGIQCVASANANHALCTTGTHHTGAHTEGLIHKVEPTQIERSKPGHHDPPIPGLTAKVRGGGFCGATSPRPVRQQRTPVNGGGCKNSLAGTWCVSWSWMVKTLQNPLSASLWVPGKWTGAPTALASEHA